MSVKVQSRRGAAVTQPFLYLHNREAVVEKIARHTVPQIVQTDSGKAAFDYRRVENPRQIVGRDDRAVGEHADIVRIFIIAQQQLFSVSLQLLFFFETDIYIIKHRKRAVAAVSLSELLSGRLFFRSGMPSAPSGAQCGG